MGATTERAYLELFRAAGFEPVEKLYELNYFARSPSQETRAAEIPPELVCQHIAGIFEGELHSRLDSLR